MNPELAQAILSVAQRNNWNPVDLGTVISYETGGTLDPWKAGPTTQWGQHRGLIQWGEPQAKQYGVSRDTSITDQMTAVEKYLKDRGLKPGAGIHDMYSTINAGAPGLYNRSDANNGGAPGTVADKVNNQMGPHRITAQKLLGMADAGMIPTQQAPSALSTPSTAVPVAASAPQPGAAVTAPVAAAKPPVDDNLMAQLAAIPRMMQAMQANQQYAPAAPVADNLRARMAAVAAAMGNTA